MKNIAIMGATTWGNTVGMLLAKKDLAVNIWAKTETRAKELNDLQKKIPAESKGLGQIFFTSDMEKALSGAEMAVFAVPAQSVRQIAKQFSGLINKNMILISLAKGLEANSGKRMTEIILEEESNSSKGMVCVLSGPNLSQEINLGLPATSVLAGYDNGVAEITRDLLNSPNFTVFLCDDVVGVEVCGALKNVIALGAGMVDGLRLGNNAKATLITFGWHEAIKIGTILGAKQSTFYSLAGLGDLITTSAGSLSRNHYVGREVASGRSLAEVKASMSNVAEGIDTTMAVHRLNHRLKLDLPIIEVIYKILFQSFPPAELANRLKFGLV
jgi:glycerol-3-phosphate dehydrogenase (NAD(P)+)